MKEIKWEIIGLAIICLTLLELGALTLGFNGNLLRFVIFVIAGLAGWTIPSPRLR